MAAAPVADASAWIRVTASGGKPEDDWGAALVRMYRLWADQSGRRAEVVAKAAGITLLKIEPAGTWDRLRFESGIHRVERVLSIPGTEKLDWVHARVDTWPDMPDEVPGVARIRYPDISGMLGLMQLRWPPDRAMSVFRGLLWTGGPLLPLAPSPSDGPYIRTYSLHPAPGVTDERCEWQTRDVESVLTGNLDALFDALEGS